MVHAAHPVFGATEEEHPFGDSRFPSIDVRDDADIAKLGDIKGHENDSRMGQFEGRTNANGFTTVKKGNNVIHRGL